MDDGENEKQNKKLARVRSPCSPQDEFQLCLNVTGDHWRILYQKDDIISVNLGKKTARYAEDELQKYKARREARNDSELMAVTWKMEAQSFKKSGSNGV